MVDQETIFELQACTVPLPPARRTPQRDHRREYGNLREPPDVHNVLIGKVHGTLGETFRFFLFVNRNAPAHLPGVPGYGFHGPHGRVLNHGLEGGALANTDVMLKTASRRGETRSRENERYDIEFAIEDTVCKRQTRKALPGALATSEPALRDQPNAASIGDIH